MRKVGLAVGVSATAIYRHFEDKDALVSASVMRGAQIFGGYLRQALREATPFDRLRQLGRRYFDFAQEHPYDYQLLFMLDCQQNGMKKLDEQAQAETNSTFVLLVDRVVECQNSGHLIQGDPSAIAVYIWSSYHGLASLRIAGRMDSSEAEYRTLVEQQLDRTLFSVREYPEAPAIQGRAQSGRPAGAC